MLGSETQDGRGDRDWPALAPGSRAAVGETMASPIERGCDGPGTPLKTAR